MGDVKLCSRLVIGRLDDGGFVVGEEPPAGASYRAQFASSSIVEAMAYVCRRMSAAEPVKVSLSEALGQFQQPTVDAVNRRYSVLPT